MNNDNKFKDKPFDAKAIDKRLADHLLTKELNKKQEEVRKELAGASFMPPRSKTSLDLMFEGDPNDSTEMDDEWPGILSEDIIATKPNKNMGASANAGMTRDDSTTATRLLDKNWSPLIIRKYQMHGWPMFIGIICDANLNDLDDLVYDVMEKAEHEHGFINGTIQGARNACGYLSDELVKHYNGIKRGVMEGNIVFWYQDKLAISSAYGDLMTHEKCAMEFYSILNMMPHI